MVLRLRVETKRCSELETANLSVASVESSLFLLKTEDMAIRSFDSALEIKKSGMFLWFEWRKTFREIPVVDGRSAMLWKLGGSALSERVIGRTRWHELHRFIAIWRPDAGSPCAGWASIGDCAVKIAAATKYGSIIQRMAITTYG